MSFVLDAIVSKALSILEEELIAHEPAMQAVILAELQSIGSRFLTSIEDKIASLEAKAKAG